MKVGTVGSIRSGQQANQLLEEGLDLAIVGRWFQKNPAVVWTFAEELNTTISMANQIAWGVSMASPDTICPLTFEISSRAAV